jgi:threonine dehydrogenase-like Zn-dependent dehydrogenase
MKALTWHGKHDIRCESVPDPKIEDAGDAIIKVTACAICGSDLHIFDGMIPEIKSGDVLGHETMGEVVEVGAGVKNLRPGDRVVVPFTIFCGECFFCKKGFYSACERSNPDRKTAKSFGATPPPVSSAIRTSWEAIQGVKQNTCACPMPMWDRSRSRTDFQTSRCCSCPTSFL